MLGVFQLIQLCESLQLIHGDEDEG